MFTCSYKFSLFVAQNINLYIRIMFENKNPINKPFRPFKYKLPF